MTGLHRILCPVDFSAASRRALAYAEALARGRGAVVSVLNVLRAPAFALAGPGGPAPPGDPAPEIDAEERRREELRRFVRPERRADVPLELRIEFGRLPEEIVNQASATRADLVVLDGHAWAAGKEGAIALTDALLREARVPVLVIAPLSRGYPHDGGFRRIVCGIDFSPVSARAVDHAADLAAEAPPAELTLVHVLEGFPPEEAAAAVAGGDLGLYWTYRDTHARESLGELATAHGGWCRTEVAVTSGSPWLELLDVAGEKDADLIVVGSDRGPASAAGGTARRLVSQAGCPVLVVPRI